MNYPYWNIKNFQKHSRYTEFVCKARKFQTLNYFHNGGYFNTMENFLLHLKFWKTNLYPSTSVNAIFLLYRLVTIIINTSWKFLLEIFCIFFLIKFCLSIGNLHKMKTQKKPKKIKNVVKTMHVPLHSPHLHQQNLSCFQHVNSLVHRLLPRSI